jgi:hypothetical protein
VQAVGAVITFRHENLNGVTAHERVEPAIGTVGIPGNFTLEPGHATPAMFGLSSDSLMDWAAAKVPFLQKQIPAMSSGH